MDAVDALPADLDAWVPPAATAFLLEKSGEHDAKALGMLGRRLLEVIDPEAADAEESRRLEAEEAEARARASFTMSDDGHGRCHGRFSLPTLHGNMLRKHLLALASPARTSTTPESPHSQPCRGTGPAWRSWSTSRPVPPAPSLRQEELRPRSS